MESLTLRSSYGWFLTGAALVNTVAFSFILLSGTFLLGFGLASWHFPLAVLLSLLLNYSAARYFSPDNSRRLFSKSTSWVLVIILLSIGVSLIFYDISADGQMYHMESAIQMKAGWNPFKKELPLDLNQAIWLNHYGKGVESPQAAIYAITGRIESTKATNFILLAASFCLCMGFLMRLNRFSYRKNLLFSGLLAFNPVTFYQLLNTYVDGQLCSFLLCFIAIAGLLFLESNRYYLFLLASVLIVVINIKFTALVFGGIFTAGMLFVFVLLRKWKTFKRAFFVSALASVFAVGVVGYFPYMINTIQYHDILYPGLPVLKSEALKFTPPRLRHENQFSKFFISFFSHTDNMHLTVVKDPVIKPKIPFTLNKTDVFNASKPYVCFIAGMGPFFSGICLSALGVFGYVWWQKKNRKTLLPVILLTGTLLFSVLIISEAWYVRYVPQLWFIPLIWLMASEIDRQKTLVWIRRILYTVMIINISFCMVSIPYVFYKTTQIQYELEQLKASHQTIPVEFTYFTSNRARFLEYDIPFREIPIPNDSATYMSSSSTKIIPPAVMPDLPKPLVLRIGDKISKRFNL